MLNFKIFRDTASYLNQSGFPPGHQYYVDSRGRDSSRKLRSYTGRGTRDKCPWAEPLSVNHRCHLPVPFYLLTFSNRQMIATYSVFSSTSISTGSRAFQDCEATPLSYSRSIMVSAKYLVSITHLNYTKGNGGN